MRKGTHKLVYLLRPRRGLTFFEMLVVFSVIAILAALVFFGTRRLMVDTQVTRAREDQRVISRALANYFVDNSQFPTENQGLDVLNGPVTYLASIPRDIFAQKFQNAAYGYRTWNSGGEERWLVVSCGPDGDIDYDQLFRPSAVTSGSGGNVGASRSPLNTMNDTLLDLSYDPTNGLRSDGDIYTLAPHYN